MYYILFDKRNNSFNRFLAEEIGASLIETHQCENQIIGWIKGALLSVKISSKHDTIICWYDFQAILCFWICRFLFLKRRIIALNILLKDKKTFRNKFVSFLYKKALLSENFKASVTSETYGSWLNEKLGIKVEYSLIHDVYHDLYEYQSKTLDKRNTVFCGGRNGRDWYFMIEVARAMPHVVFYMIMPKEVYMRYKHLFLSNMNVKYDVVYEEFMKTLCACSLVCLPLDTEAPAGLIVMFQAVANDKMVITTDTMTTKEYIGADRGVLLPNDIQQWSNAIEYYLKEDGERKCKYRNMKCFLKNECSENKFIDGIKYMLSC